jgi:type II secretory pathway pseudopilin PulG
MKNLLKSNRNGKRAMTLLELIVVIGIIMILAAVISGSLLGARAQAKRLQCLSNIRSLGQAAILYAQEDPGSRFPYSGTSGESFATLYDPMDFNDLSVFACPLERKLTSLTAPDPNFTSTEISTITYNFVKNENKTDSQTDAYPMTNILLIELSDGKSFSEEDFHGSSGRTAFLINGKTIMVGKGGSAIPQNKDRAETSYSFTGNDYADYLYK